MTTLKLIVRNVRRHLRDYLIYFLTLMLAVSLVYAFNSLSDQPALAEMSMTRALLYEQLNRLLGLLSLVACVVLAFLILYANQFLLKRRKKELGLYMMLGMRKGRIARIFAAETFLVGVLSLASGLALGVLLSQGVGLAALRLFAVELAQFELVLSLQALRQTAICFAVIFLLVMALDVCTISRLQLIALFTASRRNESVNAASCRLWPFSARSSASPGQAASIIRMAFCRCVASIILRTRVFCLLSAQCCSFMRCRRSVCESRSPATAFT